MLRQLNLSTSMVLKSIFISIRTSPVSSLPGDDIPALNFVAAPENIVAHLFDLEVANILYRLWRPELLDLRPHRSVLGVMLARV